MKDNKKDYTAYREETVEYNKSERFECVKAIEQVYKLSKDNGIIFQSIFRHQNRKPFSIPIFDSLDDIPKCRYIPIVLKNGELNQEIHDANYYDFRCHSACFILEEVQGFLVMPISDEQKIKLISKRRRNLLIEDIFVYGMLSFVLLILLLLILSLVASI